MHRLRFALLLAVFLPLPCPPASRAAEVRVLGYEIAVSARAPDSVLNVVTDVRLGLDAPTDRLRFLFTAATSLLTAEAVLGSRTVPLGTDRAGGDSLGVLVPPRLRHAGAFRLRLRYRLRRGAGAGRIYLGRGQRWYPEAIDQIAPYRVSIDLGRGWTSICGGDLTGDSRALASRRMVWTSAMPVFKIELAICPVDSVHETTLASGGVTFHFVSSRDDSAAAGRILREAAGAFAYFHRLLGAYAYRRFTILETADWPGVNIGSGIVVPGRQTVDDFVAGQPDAVRLALASQWWGAGVFPKFRSAGFWFLQLSLPHYLRLMYAGSVGGAREFQAQMEQSRAAFAAFAGTDQDVAIREIDMPDTPAKGAAIYGKGPVVVDLLASRLGAGRWRAALRALYRHYRGRTLTCGEFCGVLDARDPAHVLGSQLERMLTAKGLPERLP